MNAQKTASRAHSFKRKLIQIYAALLYNAHLKGFIKGDIYTGNTKVLCVPGLNCYSCPGAVGACPLGALQNALASTGNRAPYYMLGIILLYGLMLGRTICGWLCPMGLIQELFYKIPAPKLKKSNVTHALSYLKYFILVAFVGIIPYMYSFQNLALPAFCKYICPAGTLEGAIGLLINPANGNLFSQLALLFTRKFIILIALLCLCVFVYRAFCRFLCPLGAIYGLFSRVSIIGVKLDKPKCSDCGRCVSVCKMDIRRVGDHECINCGECINECPAGAISFKAGKITLKAPEISAEGNTDKRRTFTMKRIICCTLMLAILAGALWYFNKSEPDTAAAETSAVSNQSLTEIWVDETIPVGKETGRRAQDFSVSLYGSDEIFTLSDNLGKVTVINFWATWCAPCVMELPAFDQMYRESDGDVAFIALHSYLVTDDVEAYLEKQDYALNFALDGDNSIIQSFGGSTMLPMTVVIDPHGVITYNAVGSMTYEKLSELIAQAKGE